MRPILPTFTIRSIRKKDDAAIERIIRGCLKEFGADRTGTAWEDPALLHIFDAYQEEGSMYFVAVQDDNKRIVGGVGTAPLPGVAGTCELQKMYILPEVRGTGVAHLLIRKALAFAARHYARCYLETFTSMLAAQHFYEKYGFTRICGALGDTGHNASNVHYIKELNGDDGLCPHRLFCGGCAYMGMPYTESLHIKDRLVRDSLRAVSIETDVYKGIVPAPDAVRFSYRNKMEYTFGDFVKGGEMTLGLHVPGQFLSILTTDHCKLVPEDFNTVLRYTLDFAHEKGYAPYNKKSHSGLLRNLILRRGVRTGELLACIVTTAGDAGSTHFDAEEWKEGLLALPLKNMPVGILHVVNNGLADAVKCDALHLLYGREYYNEEICGLRFRVHLFSFFQTCVEAAERLYTDALALLPDIGGKNVLDLYCGTGTLSQVAARSAARVIGIDISEDSIAAARAACVANGIDNCTFYCGDVGAVLSYLEEEGADNRNVRKKDADEQIKEIGDQNATCVVPDVILLDPPRAGVGRRAAETISAYSVPFIVYISCNPLSLADDLTVFAASGYCPVTIRAYDNFCWTRAVETVTLLEKKIE